MRRGKGTAAIVCTMLFFIWQPVFSALPISPGNGERFLPQNVVVVVEGYTGWGPNIITTGLSGDGNFRIVGAYSDTTAIRGAVDQEIALGFVNDLLELGFFEMPSEFGNSKIRLEKSSSGDFVVGGSKTMDGGWSKISLFLGEHRHTVLLAFPASAAPPALHEWLDRFGEFMKENRGW